MRRWPKRTSLCLNCRTALCEGEQCDSRWHQTVRLRDRDGRTALIQRAFPAESSLKRSGRPKNALGPNTMWPWLAALAVCAVFAVRWPALLLLCLWTAAVWAVTRRELHHARATRRLPRGAVREPPLLRETAPIAGTVLDSEQVPSPLLGLPCVAFAITLEHTEADAVHTVLRDAATVGFAVETNDGHRVLIPRGRVRFSAVGQEVLDRDAVERHARALDPLGRRYPMDPFRHQVAREAVLRVGDRVVLHNHVEQELDPTAPPDGYREAAPSVLHPVGIPCVELIPDDH